MTEQQLTRNITWDELTEMAVTGALNEACLILDAFTARVASEAD